MPLLWVLLRLFRSPGPILVILLFLTSSLMCEDMGTGNRMRLGRLAMLVSSIVMSIARLVMPLRALMAMCWILLPITPTL